MTDPTYNEASLQEIINKLHQRNIAACCVTNSAEALDRAIALIQPGATVTQGGSVTLDQIGLRAHLMTSPGITFIDPYAEGLSAAERIERRRIGLRSDLFFCSTNAITRDGILVNRDGMGNRVAALIFGPTKVVIIAGINKIVRDIEAGIERINSIAAPRNARRLNRNTPCADTDACSDCRTPDRICGSTVITEWQPVKDRMTVILVRESLGY